MMKSQLTEEHFYYIQSQLKREPNEYELTFLNSLYISIHSIAESSNFYSTSPWNLQKCIPMITSEQEQIIIGIDSKNSLFPSDAMLDLYMSGASRKLGMDGEGIHFRIGHVSGNQSVSHVAKNPCSIFFIHGRQRIRLIINELKKQEILYNISPVFKKGLGCTFLGIIRHGNLGTMLNLKTEKNLSRFHKNRGAGFLISLDKQNENVLGKILKKAGVAFESIGSGIPTQTVIIKKGKRELAKFPLELFRFFRPDQNKVKYYPQAAVNPVVLPPIAKKYNRQFIDMQKSVKKSPGIKLFPESKIIGRNTGFIDTISGKTSLVVRYSHVELNTGRDPFMEGVLAVSAVTRKISCIGANSIGFGVAVQIGEKKCQSSDYTVRIMEGMKQAADSLNLTISNRLVVKSSKNKKAAKLHLCCVASFKKHSIPVPGVFQKDGDFILILGSHRGELGGGAYLQNKGPKFTGTPPTLELRTEAKLQEVLQVAAEGNLLQSATPIGTGGLIAGLANCIGQAEKGVAFRIHLSMKLRPDEILFGETQGLVVVSLAENDIMEFERVCMRYGIPATTIGRVTDDNRLRFNDWINLDRKKLRV